VEIYKSSLTEELEIGKRFFWQFIPQPTRIHWRWIQLGHKHNIFLIHLALLTFHHLTLQFTEAKNCIWPSSIPPSAWAKFVCACWIVSSWEWVVLNWYPTWKHAAEEFCGIVGVALFSSPLGDQYSSRREKEHAAAGIWINKNWIHIAAARFQDQAFQSEAHSNKDNGCKMSQRSIVLYPQAWKWERP